MIPIFNALLAANLCSHTVNLNPWFSKVAVMFKFQQVIMRGWGILDPFKDPHSTLLTEGFNGEKRREECKDKDMEEGGGKGVFKSSLHCQSHSSSFLEGFKA